MLDSKSFSLTFGSYPAILSKDRRLRTDIAWVAQAMEDTARAEMAAESFMVVWAIMGEGRCWLNKFVAAKEKYEGRRRASLH